MFINQTRMRIYEPYFVKFIGVTDGIHLTSAEVCEELVFLLHYLEKSLCELRFTRLTKGRRLVSSRT